jgi:excisionase family DNA binding protein
MDSLSCVMSDTQRTARPTQRRKHASSDPPNDPLLTPSEAAKAVGLAVSAETIRRWIRKGILPVVLVGPYRRAMIRRSVALRLLTSKAGPAS